MSVKSMEIRAVSTSRADTSVVDPRQIMRLRHMQRALETHGDGLRMGEA